MQSVISLNDCTGRRCWYCYVTNRQTSVCQGRASKKKKTIEYREEKELKRETRLTSAERKTEEHQQGHITDREREGERHWEDEWTESVQSSHMDKKRSSLQTQTHTHTNTL